MLFCFRRSWNVFDFVPSANLVFNKFKSIVTIFEFIFGALWPMKSKFKLNSRLTLLTFDLCCSLVYNMLEEVLISCVHRCLEPMVMEMSVSNLSLFNTNLKNVQHHHQFNLAFYLVHLLLGHRKDLWRCVKLKINNNQEYQLVNKNNVQVSFFKNAKKNERIYF